MVSDTLPADWQWTTLGEIADPNTRSIVSGPFGSNIGSRFFVDSGVPVIRGNNLTTDVTRFIDGGFVFVTEEKAKELGNCDAIVDDLIFTAAGTLGQVGIIPKNAKYPRYIISNKQLRARLDKNKIDPLFAFYWLSSKYMVEYIQQRNTGSSVPLINLSVLRSLPIPLPPLAEQVEIVHILDSLDKKIEMNRRMSKTLESIAKTIFKSWFKDFDPVQAESIGLDTKLPEEIANLFPDSFDYFNNKKLPYGWKLIKLGDVVQLIKGKSYISEELQDSDTVLVTLKSFQRGGGYRQDGLKPFVGRYHPEQKIMPGELIVSLTDVTQSADVIGKAAIVSSNPNYHTLVASLDVGIIRPINQAVNIPFLYLLLSTEDYKSHILGYCSGTTVLHLDRNGILNYCFICPDVAVMEKFFQISQPLLNRIESNIQQNNTLDSIRDILLPKLVSGKVRVGDAKQTMKEVSLGVSG